MISILPADAVEAEHLVRVITPLVAALMVARTELLGAELAPVLKGDYVEALVPTSRDFVRAVLAGRPAASFAGRFETMNTRERRLAILFAAHTLSEGPGRGDIAGRIFDELLCRCS